MRSISVSGVAILSILLCISAGRAQDQGQFEGAVWQFEISKKSNADSKLTGRVRISNDVIYQKENPEDPDFSKKIGTNQPGKGEKTTRFTVEKLRTFSGPQREIHYFSGTAVMKFIKAGEGTGIFTDDKGVNFNLRMTRINE